MTANHQGNQVAKTAKTKPAEDEPAITIDQQQTLPGAFPEIDEDLEKLISQHEAAKAMVTKATDRKTTAYDALKEAMRSRDLEEYRCYRSRYVAKMDPGDPKVKSRALKEDEPSPYQPSAAG